MTNKNQELKTRKVPFVCNEGKPMISQQIGRNDKCQCGSGLKAKKCCGNLTKYFTKK
jgi:uncharacterized protein YecA (UPF0149 family)